MKFVPMRRRRFHGCYGWPAPLDPRQRILSKRAALALLCALLAELLAESLSKPLPALSVPSTAACVQAGYELAVCVDVARSHGDWRY